MSQEGQQCRRVIIDEYLDGRTDRRRCEGDEEACSQQRRIAVRSERISSLRSTEPPRVVEGMSTAPKKVVEKRKSPQERWKEEKTAPKNVGRKQNPQEQ